MEVNIKSVDSLGRIVIPSGIRRSLNIGVDTILGIEVVNNQIILSKIDLVEEKNNELLIKLLSELLDTDIIITNLNKIIAATSRELIDEELSGKFVLTLQERQKKLANGLQISKNMNMNQNFLIYPILKNSILYGSIVIFLKNIEKFNKSEIILDLIVKLYLENYA